MHTCCASSLLRIEWSGNSKFTIMVRGQFLAKERGICPTLRSVSEPPSSSLPAWTSGLPPPPPSSIIRAACRGRVVGGCGSLMLLAGQLLWLQWSLYSLLQRCPPAPRPPAARPTASFHWAAGIHGDKSCESALFKGSTFSLGKDEFPKKRIQHPRPGNFMHRARRTTNMTARRSFE